MNIRPISSLDLIIWPDGTWTLRQDLHEYSYMSDDYIVYPEGCDEWLAFFYEDSQCQ